MFFLLKYKKKEKMIQVLNGKVDEEAEGGEKKKTLELSVENASLKERCKELDIELKEKVRS